MRNAAFAGLGLLALGVIGGSQLATAQSERAAAPAAQSQPVTSMQPNSAIQAISVSQPSNTGAVSRPKDRVASYLSAAECTGLGGTVVETKSQSCSATGKICYRADQDGVIHKACITE